MYLQKLRGISTGDCGREHSPASPTNLLLLLHRAKDRPRELLGRGGAAHVPRPDLALGNDVVHCFADPVGVVVKTQMPQHHATRENERSGVGLVLALDVQTDVTAARLEDGDLATHVAARYDTGATDETGADVGEDTTVQVGHDHDVELLGTADTLHACVVHNHVVGLNGGVFLADLLDSVAEETVGKLHDVGLVDASDLAPVVGQSKGESKLGDALTLRAGDNFQRLNDAVDGLVLKARVFTLGVLTDDAQVDVLVTGLVAGDVLDEHNASVDIELLSQGDVERLMARALHGSVEDTLQTKLIALEGGNGFAEELLRVLATGFDTGDIDLLPLNGHIVGLEDGLDRLGNLSTDTVTYACMFSRCPFFHM